LWSLGPMVISTCAGSPLKSKTTMRARNLGIRLCARAAGAQRVAGSLPYPQRCVDRGP
jgi:hypothetical protein